MFYYLTFDRARLLPPADAVRGLERAFELAPYDAGLRELVARQLLVERKGRLARQVLLPLALSPHESKQAKALNEVAELVEAGKLDEALAKLNERVAKAEKGDDDDD